MTEREKFEAWAKKQQPGTLDLTPFDDTYDSDFTSGAWEAWQAALESRVLAERKPDGYAAEMPGTNKGFTMAVFDGATVPVGTPVFTHATPDDASVSVFAAALSTVRAILTDSNTEHLAVRMNNALTFIDAAMKDQKESGE